MNEKDENIVSTLYRIIDLIRYADKVSSLNNCNNCAVKNHCPHEPRLGEMVRINCFAWEGKDGKS